MVINLSSQSVSLPFVPLFLVVLCIDSLCLHLSFSRLFILRSLSFTHPVSLSTFLSPVPPLLLGQGFILPLLPLPSLLSTSEGHLKYLEMDSNLAKL